MTWATTSAQPPALPSPGSNKCHLFPSSSPLTCTRLSSVARRYRRRHQVQNEGVQTTPPFGGFNPTTFCFSCLQKREFCLKKRFLCLKKAPLCHKSAGFASERLCSASKSLSSLNKVLLCLKKGCLCCKKRRIFASKSEILSQKSTVFTSKMHFSLKSFFREMLLCLLEVLFHHKNYFFSSKSATTCISISVLFPFLFPFLFAFIFPVLFLFFPISIHIFIPIFSFPFPFYSHSSFPFYSHLISFHSLSCPHFIPVSISIFISSSPLCFHFHSLSIPILFPFLFAISPFSFQF